MLKIRGMIFFFSRKLIRGLYISLFIVCSSMWSVWVGVMFVVMSVVVGLAP